MTILTLTQDQFGRTKLTIPAFVRDQLELKKGDRVDVRLEGETITVTPLKQEAK